MCKQPGRNVRIEGLQKKTEINGKKGKVVRLEGERWVVKVEGMDELALSAANLVVDEPAQKRARFAQEAEVKDKDSMEDASSSDGEAEEDADGEGSGEEDEAPPYTRWGEEVTTIRMIKGGPSSGIECEVARFRPHYTHQVFYTSKSKEDNESDREHQELIIGYENPELEIVYAANSLKAYIEFRHSAQVQRVVIMSPCLYATCQARLYK